MTDDQIADLILGITCLVLFLGVVAVIIGDD